MSAFASFLTICARRLALLPQSYYLLSRISTQTARHTFRLQEDDTRNIAWFKSTISHLIINTYSHVYTYVTGACVRHTVITFEWHGILGTYGIHVANTYVRGYIGLDDCVSLIHFKATVCMRACMHAHPHLASLTGRISPSALWGPCRWR